MKETLLDWLGTFWQVLIKPTPQTFLREAKKADGKFASAVSFLVIYAIFSFIAASIVEEKIAGIPTLLTLIILIPLTVILFVSVLHFICQRIFRQKEYVYDKLLYITVAILLPVFIIFLPISAYLIASDVFKILSFILFFYAVTLLTIAVKTIAKIEYWQALVAVTASIVASILIAAIIYILIASTISPPGLNQK